MKSRITIICVALASVFFIACPMPHVGVGTSKDATGTDQTAPQTTGGSISVVNDEARNQAVYINETGQRFDVAAPEYPGGPLVSCVEMADFTLVPASSDSNPLPVKALVAGTRNDGTPGVWEIHSDDTIDLPQPAVDDSGAAKCIVGGDMNTLPPGIQMNYGWGFHVSAVSKDGKMIVGYANNPKGVTIGGMQIAAGTTIGVYWRVSSQPYSRFCIVSPPRIIGSITPQPLPPKWAAHWLGRSPLLQQLWQYISGTLQSYLINESSVSLDTPQGVTAAVAQSTGTYDVMGTDQDGLPAIASIDKNGGVAIQVFVPDLKVSGVTLSISSASASTSAAPVPVFTDDSWSVSATLTNEGTYQATNVVAKYWLSATGLSSDGTFDTTTAIKLLDTAPVTPNPFPVGQTITITSPQKYSLSSLGVTTPGTYYIVVTVAADPKNGEIDLSDNQAQAVIAAQVRQTGSPILTVSVSGVTPVDLFFSPWTFSATVTNSGTGTSTGSTLTYSVNGKAAPPVTVGTILPNGSQTYNLFSKVSDLTSAPGTYNIAVTDGSSTVVAAIVVTSVDLTVSVSPNPVQVHLGGTWSFNATVTNSGTGIAGPSTLEYIVNGQTKQASVPSIAPNGGSQTVILTGNVSDLASVPVVPGNYHITVIADALNVVAETNENNNTADAVVAVMYNEIFIDTYSPDTYNSLTNPTGANSAPISNYMELWSSDGKTRFASYDGINNFRTVNPGYAFIDYTAGLAPGDYWVLVEESGNGSDPLSYSIRVLSAPSNDYHGWIISGGSSETTTDTPLPTVLEPALQGAWPSSSWPPTTTVQPMLLDTSNLPTSTNHLNRNVVSVVSVTGIGGVNWVKIHLP